MTRLVSAAALLLAACGGDAFRPVDEAETGQGGDADDAATSTSVGGQGGSSGEPADGGAGGSSSSASASTGGPPPCGPATCAGCCDAEGACVTGDDDDACGEDGGACDACEGACGAVTGDECPDLVETYQACSMGQCVAAGGACCQPGDVCGGGKCASR